MYQAVADIAHDESVGFQLISTDDIDDYGIVQVIKKIRERIGDSPVYLRCVCTPAPLHALLTLAVSISMSSVRILM
jgi:hypothetical protein